MNKIMHLILICVLIGVSVWSVITYSWHILVTNICVISGVLIDDKVTKSLMREKVNVPLMKKLQKIPTVLYAIGAISLIIYGVIKFYT